MRHRIINKKLTLSWVFSLLMVTFFAAIADTNDTPYSMQLTAGQNNPWALPKPDQAPENYPGFQQQPAYDNQQYQGQQYHGQQYQNQQHQSQQYQGSAKNRKSPGGSSQNRIYQGNRFVTDEFLETLNRQQSQFQVMPDSRRYPQYAPNQSAPLQQKSISPGAGTYGLPSYGTGYVDPLVDTLSDVPVVTPWTPWDIGVSDW